MAAFDPQQPSYFLQPQHLPLPGARIEVIDPASLEHVGWRGEAGTALVEEVVAAVNRAQAGWRALDAKSRARVLHAVAHALETSGGQACAELMTREMGKPYPEALGELANCASVFRYFAEMARDEAGKVAGSTQAGSFQYARYEPLGVSVHILPYNFPILLLCWTLAASLAAGNGCIVKPAPATTLCTLEFLSLLRDLPEGLLAGLPGGTPVAQALIDSPHTHAVAFTGSVAAGRAVAMACAAHMKPCVIEAGGSDPMIIAASAPVDVAAAGAATAAFHLSGQVCTSTERIYAVDAVHDRFVAELAQRARALRVGHGLGRSEIGPLVSEAARNKVQRLVEQACAEGAQLVTGGRVPAEAGPGWFYEPTVLAGVTQGMAIVREECFGPVACVLRVADFAEALQLANDSEFGLGASVFTTSLEEAMEAAEQLQAGMVWVNNPLIDNDALPFGGWKHSGLGRELSRLGLDAFRRSKMVVIDHKPRVQEWWYPYPDSWFYQPGGKARY
jgi:acyl-CoA reductase-like NAD-dependent aldehyde dehydrogenase